VLRRVRACIPGRRLKDFIAAGIAGAVAEAVFNAVYGVEVIRIGRNPTNAQRGN
jgi:hypothetical protein